MTRAPRDQFTVDLPNGLVIERLPVGFAHGQWRVRFVLSGTEAVRDRAEGFMGLAHDVEEFVTVEGIGAPLLHRDSAMSGGSDERDLMWTFVGKGLTGMRFTYQFDGDVFATEVIDLSQ